MSEQDRPQELRARIAALEEELKQKNAVLELYADYRNWVQPPECRQALGIPDSDPNGQEIPDPHQCFVAARFAWEPALKVLLGQPQGPASPYRKE